MYYVQILACLMWTAVQTGSPFGSLHPSSVRAYIFIGSHIYIYIYRYLYIYISVYIAAQWIWRWGLLLACTFPGRDPFLNIAGFYKYNSIQCYHFLLWWPAAPKVWVFYVKWVFSFFVFLGSRDVESQLCRVKVIQIEIVKAFGRLR